MATARLKVLLQDNALATSVVVETTEDIEVSSEIEFGDGPSSDRVRVVDVDLETGVVVVPLAYTPPKPGGKKGKYVAEQADDDDPSFLAWLHVNAYGLVMRTIELFEYPDVLGRKIQWQFDASQLTVRPRAANNANAQYRRDTASLNFGYFTSKIDAQKVVYTALSRDIVAHETAHAVVDSIAPDLIDGGPASLAMHEALADLTALLMALRSQKLREGVLAATNYELDGSTPFNSIGEEMGYGRGQDGSLRDLNHQLTMSKVNKNSAHDLSQVLSGALFAVFLKAYKADVAAERKRNPTGGDKQVTGKALGIGSERFRRITLRALDYLPAGEATFIDYGRAIVAADRAAHPDHPRERDWVRNEFVAREIAETADDLESDIVFPNIPGLDPEELLSSDTAVQRLIDEHRVELGVPADAAVEIRPRIAVERETYPAGTTATTREIIIRFVWFERQTGLLIPGFPPAMDFRVGCTIVVDRDAATIRSALVSTAARAQGGARATMAAEFHAGGQLAAVFDEADPSLDGGPQGRIVNGAMRLFNAGAALHAAPPLDPARKP